MDQQLNVTFVDQVDEVCERDVDDGVKIYL